MSWDTKQVYPNGATKTVTVRATYAQKVAWDAAAKKYGKGTAGGFLAWAATLTIAGLNALEVNRTWPDSE